MSMERADEVDASGPGAPGWTLLTTPAGWRGRVRRRKGNRGPCCCR
ncbi:hypothetical protein ACFSUJ_10450 [Streptomyces lusitanus]|uniref:Uncharacterized protein n=1 Tax=Streptomyces lusitanus TaxID=68232 RepID=A0ABU3JIG4_9ACTN|nr:hypothetical protein [Streptomyces lusitanus]